MLIKPYGDLGENFTPSEDETYLGVVVENNDPLQLGRIQVLASIYEDLDFDQLPWCFPVLGTFLGNSKDSIMFSVPEIGSEVRLSFPTKDKYAPFYSGCELNNENKSTFFDEDYPECYGIKDSKGNFIKVNKKKKKITVQHSSTTNVEIIEDGTTTLTMPDGTVIKIDKSGNIFKDDVASESYNSDGYYAFDNGANNLSMLSGDTKFTNTGLFSVDSLSADFTGDVSAQGSLSAGNGLSGMFSLSDGRVLYFANGILVGCE